MTGLAELAAVLGFFMAVNGAAWGQAAPVAPPGPGLALDGAIAIALRQNANIQLSQQLIEAGRGNEKIARGPFDTVATAGTSSARSYRQLRRDEALALETMRLTPHDQITETTSYRLGLQQTLQSGAVMGGALVVDSVQDNAQRMQGIPPQSSVNLEFTLRLPLLRSAGRDTVTAALQAAGFELDAAHSEFAHINAQVVLNVTLAYWDYLARSRQLAIATESEQRARQLLAEMQRLAAADQIPRAELELIGASAAEKTATRIAVEQLLAESRRALARLLGVSARDAVRLALPTQDYPRSQDAPVEEIAVPEPWIERSLLRRADLAAELARERAARARVTVARNNLRPQLDFNVALGYGASAQSVAISNLDTLLGRRFSGPAVSVSLAYQFPVQNNAADGLFIAQSAALDASLVRQRDLRNTIGASVENAVQALRRTARQLSAGREAVLRYSTALRNERRKRELGTATLIDVLNIEDRYDNALTAAVQREQAFANAIAQLRFEAGVLVARKGESFNVRVDDLLSHRLNLDE